MQLLLLKVLFLHGMLNIIVVLITYAHLYGAFQLAQQKIRVLETDYAAFLARVDAADIP